MTAVPIPAELAADVAARPEAYRPRAHVAYPVDLLVLAADDVSLVGTDLRVRHPAEHARAWALVGSVDGGERPDVGSRVLVLDCNAMPSGDAEHVGQLGRVGSWGDEVCLSVDLDSGDACAAARWALLPPAADPGPTDAVEGPPARGGCPGALNLAGEHFACDQAFSPHGGLACTNVKAQAVWAGEGEEANPPTAIVRPVPAARRWRLGHHWRGHEARDPARTMRELATVIEEFIEPPRPDGRRPDDRLVGSLLAADATLVVDAVNAYRPESVRIGYAQAERDLYRAERDGARKALAALLARFERIQDFADPNEWKQWDDAAIEVAREALEGQP